VAFYTKTTKQSQAFELLKISINSVYSRSFEVRFYLSLFCYWYKIRLNDNFLSFFRKDEIYKFFR
jgi:hypothetical protein